MIRHWFQAKRSDVLPSYEQVCVQNAQDNLLGVHPSQQVAFAQACRQLPFHDKMALFRDKSRVKRLLLACVQADAPTSRDALLSLATLVKGGTQGLPTAKDLRARAWQLKRAAISFESVRLSERSAEEYARRFSGDRQMCRLLVDENFLLPDAFLERFDVDASEVARWIREGKIHEQHCIERWTDRPDILSDRLLQTMHFRPRR